MPSPRSHPQAAIAGAVSVRRPDPVAWEHALLLAAGDVRRLKVAEDGTILVSNAPRR